MAEITQMYVTRQMVDHTSRERFDWLSLKREFLKKTFLHYDNIFMPMKLSQITTTAVAARARMERLVSTAATVTVVRVRPATVAPRVRQVN